MEDLDALILAGEDALDGWGHEKARMNFDLVLAHHHENKSGNGSLLHIRALGGLALIGFRIGDYYAASIRLREAAQVCERCVELGVLPNELRILYAHVLRLQGATSDAVGILNQIIADTEDTFWSMRAKGVLAEIQGQDDWWVGSAPPDIEGVWNVVFEDDFERGFSDGWEGHELEVDPSTRNGVTLYSRKNRGLGFPTVDEVTAPRILRDTTNDCVIQVLSLPNRDGRPSIGGVVFWVSSQNFVCLGRGQFGTGDLVFYGLCDGELKGWGQVRISDVSLHLRLMRDGDRVLASCSRDGQRWVLVGEAIVNFAPKLKVGMFTSGYVEPYVYLQIHQAGTAMLFQNFRLWQKKG